MRSIPVAGDAELAVDGIAIAIVSVAIVTASQHIAVMTALVCAVIAARFVAWTLIPRASEVRLGHELAFFAICLGVGAFNDWNSVVNHEIYDYHVPSAVSWSTIPVWMLLYWGLILRFVATLCRWQRLSPPATVDNSVATRAWQSPVARIALLLAVVAVTRQLIYRFYDHPVWSWLPFAVALIAVLPALRPTRHDAIIVGLFLLGGPAIEALYIQLGDLHYYELGWLGGVPVWIALWWVLSVVIWKDLSGRILSQLTARGRSRAPISVAAGPGGSASPAR